MKVQTLNFCVLRVVTRGRDLCYHGQALLDGVVVLLLAEGNRHHLSHARRHGIHGHFVGTLTVKA